MWACAGDPEPSPPTAVAVGRLSRKITGEVRSVQDDGVEERRRRVSSTRAAPARGGYNSSSWKGNAQRDARTEREAARESTLASAFICNRSRLRSSRFQSASCSGRHRNEAGRCLCIALRHAIPPDARDCRRFRRAPTNDIDFDADRCGIRRRVVCVDLWFSSSGRGRFGDVHGLPSFRTCDHRGRIARIVAKNVFKSGEPVRPNFIDENPCVRDRRSVCRDGLSSPTSSLRNAQ